MQQDQTIPGKTYVSPALPAGTETLGARLRRIAALVADVRIAQMYDWERSLRPFDMTHGRRGNAIAKLEQELRAAEREGDLPTPSKDELREALERKARTLCSSFHVSDGVVDALIAVAHELELPVPTAVVKARESGKVHYSGGGRSRQAQADRRARQRAARGF